MSDVKQWHLNERSLIVEASIFSRLKNFPFHVVVHILWCVLWCSAVKCIALCSVALCYIMLPHLTLYFVLLLKSSFSQMATFFAVAWGVSVVCFIFSGQFGVSPYFHPLALTCFFLLFFVNTLDMFYRHARFWLLKSLVSNLQ